LLSKHRVRLSIAAVAFLPVAFIIAVTVDRHHSIDLELFLLDFGLVAIEDLEDPAAARIFVDSDLDGVQSPRSKTSAPTSAA
jgi:hypothetical protein